MAPDTALDADTGSRRAPVMLAAKDLHVMYEVYSEQRLSAKELAARRFRKRITTEVHAIRGVTFGVRQGEAVGVIGRNGSGKSTLLRTVAGLQTPTSGTALVKSQPRLLGVGATLQPKLSGYRNIVLGSLAMGLRMSEVDQAIDEVIDFAELRDSIDRPLRTYSSGMRARLAFGIATLRAPDIMLIDEALAVGDKQFKKKSLSRLRAMQAEAGCLLMVTHNLNEIRQTCDRAIWLDSGKIVMDGSVENVLDAYDEDE